MSKRITPSFVLLPLGGLWELLYEFTETDRHGLRYICVSWSVAQPEMKVLHSLGPCADRQRQYQDAPLGWIWPINVDRVNLVSAKEIVCLWLCVCQRVCKFEKYFKEKARACVFVFYSRSLRGYQTSRPCMCVSRCDVRQDTTVFCVVKLMFSVRAPVGELLGLSRKWWGRQLSESSCSECVVWCVPGLDVKPVHSFQVIERTFTLHACNTIISNTGPGGEAGLQCHAWN